MREEKVDKCIGCERTYNQFLYNGRYCSWDYCVRCKWHSELEDNFIEYKRDGICYRCEGTGIYPSSLPITSEHKICLACNGTGKADEIEIKRREKIYNDYHRRYC